MIKWDKNSVIEAFEQAMQGGVQPSGDGQNVLEQLRQAVTQFKTKQPGNLNIKPSVTPRVARGQEG